MSSPYYRNPEGTDFPTKFYYVSTRSAIIAGVISTFDVVVNSRPKGFVPTLGRVLYMSWPIMAMSTTFITTTYLATNIRKKDDEFNYALAGLASGCVFGVWIKRGRYGFVAAALMALGGVVKKQAVDNKVELFPKAALTSYSTPSSLRRDYSLTSELPGNWTTGQN